MMSAIHGFAEAARLVGIFSGTLKSGEYTWAGALATWRWRNTAAWSAAWNETERPVRTLGGFSGAQAVDSHQFV